MTITEALQEELGIRVTYGNRWLIWDEGMDWLGSTKGAWVVCGCEYGQRKTRTIVTTMDEGLAIRYLLYKELVK